MQISQQNNKRIAKNTLFLYIRMFIMLAVGLFTSRVVLDALGETDYGIYNIIGGVVVLFSFLNQALTSATQRFLNFNLGKRDMAKVESVFCMSMNSYLILSAIFLVLAETVGLWFVNTQLNIPAERMAAANWVYQFSIITFIINLIRIPYNASIIAYERMDFFAYVSLVEIVLKLVVVYALFIDGIDRLIVYSLLYTIVPFVINIAYKVYCNKKFTTTRFRRTWDKETFRSLFSFSGWSLFGSMANVVASQGVNILINIFFGVAVNAAVGIANQVSAHVMQFVSNFQTAFQPQIVKTYAANQMEEFNKLVIHTSKYSYFLMFIISLPLLLKTQTILALWLAEVPQNTAIFCQLILIFMMIEAIAAPMWMAIQSTGRIRRYQIWMASCILLNFLLVYIVFLTGMPVYTAFVIKILVDLLTASVRCLYMYRYMHFPVMLFVKKALLPMICVTIASVPVPIITTYLLDNGIVSLLAIVGISIPISCVFIYVMGLDIDERRYIKTIAKEKFIDKCFRYGF